MPGHLYELLPDFVLRTPLFPLSRLGEADFSNPDFMDALYFASPQLYSELKRNPKMPAKMLRTLTKYWHRAATRSTPFGLFAAISCGRISVSDKTALRIGSQIKSRTTLDSELICDILDRLNAEDSVIDKILYYPNDTVNRIGDKLHYLNASNWEIKLSSVAFSEETEAVLSFAKGGKTFGEIVDCLKNTGHSKNEVTQFVRELISSQLLMSELSLNVYGEDALQHIIGLLKKRHVPDTGFLPVLASIQDSLRKSDSEREHDASALGMEIREQLHEVFGIDRPKVLRADSLREIVSARFSQDLLEKVLAAVDFLGRINLSPKSDRMSQFEKVFSERYETQPVKMLTALDESIGIGYPVSGHATARESLIDGLQMPSPKKDDTKLSEYESCILKKLVSANSSLPESVSISEEDFPASEPSLSRRWTATIPVIIEFADTSNGTGICLKTCGGSTAAGLAGRFCPLSEKLKKAVSDICDIDAKAHPGQAVAEIVHIPSKNTDNITHRPRLRKYAVTCLCPGEDDDSIPASELMLQLTEKGLTLYSSKTGKRIVPKMSDAHNYSRSYCSAYQFLCDYQSYKEQTPWSASVDRLLRTTGYVPRVCFHDIILSKRLWVINEEAAAKGIACMKERLRLPSMVTIRDGDNKLAVNLDRPTDTEILARYLKRRHNLVLEEFLQADGYSPISDGHSSFCGEVVFFLKRCGL